MTHKLCALLIFFSASLNPMARPSVEVQTEEKVDDNTYVDIGIWYGPGGYDGVWFGSEEDWHHHHHHDDRHGGGHGHSGGGHH